MFAYPSPHNHFGSSSMGYRNPFYQSYSSSPFSTHPHPSRRYPQYAQYGAPRRSRYYAPDEEDEQDRYLAYQQALARQARAQEEQERKRRIAAAHAQAEAWERRRAQEDAYRRQLRLQEAQYRQWLDEQQARQTSETHSAVKQDDHDAEDQEGQTVPDTESMASSATAVEENDSTSADNQERPKLAYEEAVSVLEKHLKRKIAIRRSLSALSKIRTSFEASRTAFTLPASLVFNKQKSTATQPVLAYDAVNRPLLAYEESLLRLLMQIDDITSAGSISVKTARKALVKDIEREMARLDRIKAGEYEKQQSTSSQAI